MGAPRAGIDAITVIAVMMVLMTAPGIAKGQTHLGQGTSSDTETTRQNPDSARTGRERTPDAATPAPGSAAAAVQRSQALSCVIGGTVAAAGAWAYAQFVVMATVTGATAPVLIPALAASFVTGCGIGTIALPGIGSIITGSR